MRRLRGLVWALGSLATLACGNSQRCPVDAAALVRGHLDRYPSLEPQDAYKLLHQASMGSEHAVSDPEAARAWMAREWDSMGDGPDERLIDTLGAGGRFARVHLRPWRKAGGSPDPLVAAFVQTANGAAADTASLSCTLDQLTSLARQGDVPWSPSAVEDVVARGRAAGYPAMHHSPGYTDAVRPAYRVVAVDLIPGLLTSLRTSPRP